MSEGETHVTAGDEVELHIDRLAYGGQGVGRVGGMVLFVDRTAPGDQVRARVERLRRRYAEGTLVRVEKNSPQRVAPRCRHVQDGCGGCSWQHLSYQAQLESKTAEVQASLERLGGFQDIPMRPIIAAPSVWNYRNKMEFAFHPEAGLGLHVKGSWQQVFTLKECFLQSPLAVAAVKAARDFARAHGLPLWEPRTRQGYLRELVVRQSHATGETMVGIITGPGPFERGGDFAELMAGLDPSVISVVHARKSSMADAAPIDHVDVLRGKPTITDRLHGLRFQVGIETFFQSNTAQAERLVDLVRQLAGPVAGAKVVDVYCGVGIFTLALATGAAQVAGVEIVSASIEAARANAADNELHNVSFFAGDARRTLPEALAQLGSPRVVVLDPPRAGAGGKVMRRIARAAPERIVYVSCNPTTLARDLQELRPFGYQLTAVQPIDLFPQTYHVEAVVALERGA